jgi:hypothetical protein
MELGNAVLARVCGEEERPGSDKVGPAGHVSRAACGGWEDAIPRGNQIIFLFLIKYGTTTLLRLPFFLGIFLAVLPVVGICNNCQRRTSFDPAADFQGAQIYLVFLLIILFFKKTNDIF